MPLVGFEPGTSSGIFGSEAYNLGVRAENTATHSHNRIMNPRGMGVATAAQSSANLKKKSWLLHGWPMNQEEEMWPSPAAVKDATLMMKVYHARIEPGTFRMITVDTLRQGAVHPVERIELSSI